jgi:hypothetical protein
MKTLNLNNPIKLKGIITIRAYKAGTNELVKEIVQRNMIMQSSNRGKDLIVQRLIGTNTYSLNINYGAIGTGSTAVTVTDTQLATESARTTVAYSQDVSNSEARIQFYFPNASLSNTTYREFGTFIDGSGTANSGQLFNRALFSTPYTKVTGTDTTVEVSIVFT